MKFRSLITALIVAMACLVGPALIAGPASAASGDLSPAAKVACTKSSSGKCVRAGQVCAKAQKGKVGRDAQGRTVKCKGAGNRPHWRTVKAKKVTKPKSSGRCDSNYSGACVPIASDVDCAGGSGNGPAYVSGPVYVVGSDIYDLDRDGDGVACD